MFGEGYQETGPLPHRQPNTELYLPEGPAGFSPGSAQFAAQALPVFQVYRKEGKRLKPLPSHPEGCEGETGHTILRSSLLCTACVSLSLSSPLLAIC